MMLAQVCNCNAGALCGFNDLADLPPVRGSLLSAAGSRQLASRTSPSSPAVVNARCLADRAYRGRRRPFGNQVDVAVPLVANWVVQLA